MGILIKLINRDKHNINLKRIIKKQVILELESTISNFFLYVKIQKIIYNSVANYPLFKIHFNKDLKSKSVLKMQ